MSELKTMQKTAPQIAKLNLVSSQQSCNASEHLALRIENLNFERNDELILTGLTFTVYPGEFLQIFGRNGSGKSTLLRLIAGLLSPTTGMIHLPEFSIFRPLYLGHAHGHRGMLTPYENQALLQTLHGIKVNKDKIMHVLHSLALPASGTRLCNQMSAGQQRRVALARLRLIPAQLWILDEPTTALDKEGQHILEKWMNEHLNNGGMIIMATHTEINTTCGIARSLTLDSTRG